jgi:hypothetical protein
MGHIGSNGSPVQRTTISTQCFLTHMANGDKVAIAVRVSGDKVAIGCSRVAIPCFPCVDHL